jgi:hypothetical protein
LVDEPDDAPSDLACREGQLCSSGDPKRRIRASRIGAETYTAAVLISGPVRMLFEVGQDAGLPGDAGPDLRQQESRKSVTCRFIRGFLCVIIKSNGKLMACQRCSLICYAVPPSNHSCRFRASTAVFSSVSLAGVITRISGTAIALPSSTSTGSA